MVIGSMATIGIDLVLLVHLRGMTHKVLFCIADTEENLTKIDLKQIATRLDIKVCGVNSAYSQSAEELEYSLSRIIREKSGQKNIGIQYQQEIETALGLLMDNLKGVLFHKPVHPRFAGLALLCGNDRFIKEMENILNIPIASNRRILDDLEHANDYLDYAGIKSQTLNQTITNTAVEFALEIADKAYIR